MGTTARTTTALAAVAVLAGGACYAGYTVGHHDATGTTKVSTRRSATSDDDALGTTHGCVKPSALRADTEMISLSGTETLSWHLGTGNTRVLCSGRYDIALTTTSDIPSGALNSSVIDNQNGFEQDSIESITVTGRRTAVLHLDHRPSDSITTELYGDFWLNQP